MYLDNRFTLFLFYFKRRIGCSTRISLVEF